MSLPAFVESYKAIRDKEIIPRYDLMCKEWFNILTKVSSIEVKNSQKEVHELKEKLLSIFSFISQLRDEISDDNLEVILEGAGIIKKDLINQIIDIDNCFKLSNLITVPKEIKDQYKEDIEYVKDAATLISAVYDEPYISQQCSLFIASLNMLNVDRLEKNSEQLLSVIDSNSTFIHSYLADPNRFDSKEFFPLACSKINFILRNVIDQIKQIHFLSQHILLAKTMLLEVFQSFYCTRENIRIFSKYGIFDQSPDQNPDQET